MSIWKRWVYTQKLRKDNVLNRFEQLKKWQWLNEHELKMLQEERLSALLVHAYRYVPYYRDVLTKSGVITSGGKVNISAFEQIPFLTKDIIRTNFKQLKSEDLNQRDWYVNTSGGSTGEPVQFIQDREYNTWGTAIKLLDDEWSRRKIGEKQIRLWGSERDLLVGNETIKVRLGRYVRNEKWLNSFRMTPEQLSDYVNVINDFKPTQILAYVESIYELAKFVEENNLSIYHPKSIMTSAGTLYPHMRDTIERVFQTKVFNRYGSREVGDIACECEHHKGLHVSALTHYVEIIRGDGILAEPGEMGEIVVTSLVNYAMPLIRYRIGDMGTWAKYRCECGRNMPLIEEIGGRTTDFFIDSYGKKIDGRIFNTFLWNRSFIKKYQVVQKAYGLIVVRIVLNSGSSLGVEVEFSNELDDIRKEIQRVMGKNCVVRFEFMNNISPTSSGKYRYTISEVK